jgi:hypothetical protein
MSLIRKVTVPVGSQAVSAARAVRSLRSWPVMNPTGTIPCFFAAVSRRLRARSRADGLSNATRSNRDNAARTCGSSWIGSRRCPAPSM